MDEEDVLIWIPFPVHNVGYPKAIGAVSVINHFFGRDNITLGAFKGNFGAKINGIMEQPQQSEWGLRLVCICRHLCGPAGGQLPVSCQALWSSWGGRCSSEKNSPVSRGKVKNLVLNSLNPLRTGQFCGDGLTRLPDQPRRPPPHPARRREWADWVRAGPDQGKGETGAPEARP